MGEKKIKRISLADDAYEALRTQILENKMAPGFQAMETEVAASLAMSRTPVREALLRLESEGLVELIPRRGIRVLPLSVNDMREIYQILTSLESDAAARLADSVMSRKNLEELTLATERMNVAMQQEDLDAWARADNDFHTKILELDGNQRLLNVARNLGDQAHRVRMMTLRLRKRPTNSAKAHHDIIKAIENRDAELARKLFRQHRDEAVQELSGILEMLNLRHL